MAALTHRTSRRQPRPGPLAAVGFAFLLNTCAGMEPMEYTAIDQIPPGPGLITGDDGDFVLYRRPGKREVEKDD